MWSDNPGEIYAGSEHPEGELAAFALNALDDAEFQAVFHHVIRCPHCQEVLLGFQDTAARLTAAAPETPLPAGLRQRVLTNSVGRSGGSGTARRVEPDPRWSMRRLRRWIAPVAIGAMSIALVASLGLIMSQQEEIHSLEAEREQMTAHQETVALVSASAAVAALGSADRPPKPAEAAQANDQPPAAATAGEVQAVRTSDSPNLARNINQEAGSSQIAAPSDGETESVDLVKKEMADMVQATVLSAQPETEKLSMTSPLGTEPTAHGLLMLHPSGKRGVLMVAGMPADTYQIWLVRNDQRMLIDRIVVNENDGSGVKELELDESVFGFHEVALLPDERHGPTVPTGEKFLSARIIGGPPVPPAIWRGR